MISAKALVCLSLAAAVHATGIHWGPCDEGEFNSTLPIECGTLLVPLDYTDPKPNKTIALEIVRIPALTQPSLGSIQCNFGGPGELGRSGLVGSGPLLQQLSGGAYDLLAFDPRGVGKTIPLICTENPFYISRFLSEQRLGNQADNARKRLWARAAVDPKLCTAQGNFNETAEFVGTAFTVRDMMSVVDALDEDGLLRFWGFSYGTTLGATAAAMFPDRIDKMIIDGVLNSHEYYRSMADIEEWTDSDSVLSYFFTSCIEAGPEKCILASLNKTAAEVESDLWKSLADLRDDPIPSAGGLLDLPTVQGFIAEQLKFPARWPEVAFAMLTFIYGSEQEKLLFADAFVPSNVEGEAATLGALPALIGIRCGDRVVRADTYDEVEPNLDLLEKTSRLQGPLLAWLTTTCARWPWQAKEVYNGDFHARTLNPILVASNTRDAHTPLRSAFNASATLEGSRLLEVNGTGHCTIASPSVCNFKSHLRYWLNGTLPEVGAVCNDVRPPFDGYKWADVFAEVAGVNKTTVGRRELYRHPLMK